MFRYLTVFSSMKWIIKETSLTKSTNHQHYSSGINSQYRSLRTGLPRGEFVKKSEHNFTLDCFRILALFMVLSVHISGSLIAAPKILTPILGYGAYGVALYFLLAGYFAYPSVKKEKSIQAYANKKAMRILPMYYLSLLFTFVLGTATNIYPLKAQWLYHVFCLNMFIPAPQWEWWHSVNFFWTIPAFVAWYILSPLVFRWVTNVHRAAGIALFTAATTTLLKRWMYRFASEQFVNWNFFCLMYVFFFGVLAYFVKIENCFRLGIIYGVVIGVAGFAAGNRSGFFVFGIAFYFAVVIANILPIKWNSEIVKGFINSMSEVTYSVYLTHWFLLTTGKSIWQSLPWLLSYVGFICAAWGLGYVTYKYCEQPIYVFLRNKSQIL